MDAERYAYTCPTCGWHTMDTRLEQHTCPGDDPQDSFKTLLRLLVGNNERQYHHDPEFKAAVYALAQMLPAMVDGLAARSGGRLSAAARQERLAHPMITLTREQAIEMGLTDEDLPGKVGWSAATAVTDEDLRRNLMTLTWDPRGDITEADRDEIADLVDNRCADCRQDSGYHLSSCGIANLSDDTRWEYVGGGRYRRRIEPVVPKSTEPGTT